MPFGLPEKGAPELLALLTFIAGFTLISDAIVGVAFGGTIFYWTCVGAAGGYAGVLLGFLTGLPIVFATYPAQSNLLPRDDDSHFCINSTNGALKKLGKLLTLLYLTMDACLAGGVLGAALAGGLGLILELWYAPQEGEFYAERDIHHIMPAYNWGIFIFVYVRNVYKTISGWVPRMVEEMHEWRPKEALEALF